MPYSHHSHSGQFCRHAKGTLEEVVKEAIAQNFIVYGLTEHVPRYRSEDLYPEEGGMSMEDLLKTFDDFVGEAHRLKVKYSDKITLMVGLETDFITSLDLDSLERLLRRHGAAIEYIVGSVHHVNEIPIDFDLPTFDRALGAFEGDSGFEGLISAYLDSQYTLMQRFHPEIIGHFDLFRLYHPNLQLRDSPEVWAKVERNVQFAVQYGALFELNAAAFRKGWDGPYPGPDVIECVLRFGGRFALSDDSHGPHAVGLNYDRLLEYLLRIGLKELWYLESSAEGEFNNGGRISRPVKVITEWWTSPFWDRSSSVPQAPILNG